MNNDPDSGGGTTTETKTLTYGAMTGFLFEFGFFIAIPMVLLVLLGKWLDARYDKHFYVVLGVLAAVFTSFFLVLRSMKRISSFYGKEKK